MEFHLQIEHETRKIGDFQIEAQEFEITENIHGIPADRLKEMRCHAHKFSMTCDFNWKKVSIFQSFYYSSTFSFINEIMVLLNINVVNYYFLGS